MKVGMFSSWVSLVQRRRFNDQNTQTTRRNNCYHHLANKYLWGEILYNANMDLFKTCIFLDDSASLVLRTECLFYST